MTRTRKILAVGMLAVVIAFVVAVPLLGLRMQVSVTQQFVGPDEEAIALLLRGASLPEIQAAVARSGKQPDQIMEWRGTLLLWAAARSRIDVASWLLGQGANPDGVWHGIGGVPLEEAVRRGNVEMVRLLVEAGADPDLNMIDDVTPRIMADKRGNRAIMEALGPARAAATAPSSQPAESGPTRPADGTE